MWPLTTLYQYIQMKKSCKYDSLHYQWEKIEMAPYIHEHQYSTCKSRVKSEGNMWREAILIYPMQQFGACWVNMTQLH